MALFNKIFSSSKRKTANLSTSKNASQLPFNKEQVRIVLYRECDWRGRRLLFDSSAVQRVHMASAGRDPKNPTNNYIETCDGFGYKYSRPNSDSGSLGEMVFGSVAMSFRGTALKVHWLESPTRLLCSQVFLSPVRTNTFAHSTDSQHTGSDISSLDTNSINSFSFTMSVCTPDNLNNLLDKTNSIPLDTSITSMDENRSAAYSAEDSGYSGTDPWSLSSRHPYSSVRSSFGSMLSEHESLRRFSNDSTNGDQIGVGGGQPNQNSDGNVHRRVLKNMSTSFENKSSVSDFIGYVCDNFNGVGDTYVSRRRYSEAGEQRVQSEIGRRHKNSDPAVHYNSCPGAAQYANTKHSRRAKLGLAICITLNESMEKEMEMFCSEHIVLLESMLCRLRATAENAYINRNNFMQIMLRGWQTISIWITDLFKAPRLNNPIWLTLSCGNSNNPDQLAHNFMSELCGLLNSADTKDTNFFISTLVTAILTNHLGWVGTVAPLISNTSSSPSDTTTTKIRTKISDISKSHPYSALWAQIGDLYGSIGNPPKISKTIVCGRDTNALEKILNVLTYFVRCGEIKREFKDKVIEKSVIDNIMDNINDNCLERIVPSAENSSPSKMSSLSAASRLQRTSTCVKNLSVLINNIDVDDECKFDAISVDSTDPIDSDDVDKMSGDEVIEAFNNEDSVMKKNVMNDIPKVFVYRDSHFVKQELRVGNFLMDTGIEMNQKLKTELKNYQIKNNLSSTENIKLTLTSPDNIEYSIADSSFNLSNIITENNLGHLHHTDVGPIAKLFFDLKTIGDGGELITTPTDENENRLEGNEFKRSKSLYTKSQNSKKMSSTSNQYIRRSKIVKNNNKSNTDDKYSKTPPLNSVSSISDLIKSNNVGCSKPLIWGEEPSKEGVTFEMLKFLENKNAIDNNTTSPTKSTSRDGGVVFVLGDDEELIDIKYNKKPKPLARSVSLDSNATPPISTDDTGESSVHVDKIVVEKVLTTSSPQVTPTLNPVEKMCKHKYKKHSGVKFNFEQYPQIATNYMKNKNLDISNYNFLEKGLKIEKEMRLNYGASTSTLPNGGPFNLSKTEIVEEDEECDCCRNGGANFLTTPSNASELEYSCDLTENNHYPSSCSSHEMLTTPSNASELEFSCDSVENGHKENIQLNGKCSEKLTSMLPISSSTLLPKSKLLSSVAGQKLTSCNVTGNGHRLGTKVKENNLNNDNCCTPTDFKIICIPIPKSKPRVKQKTPLLAKENSGGGGTGAGCGKDVNKTLFIFNPGFIPSLFIGVSDHYIPDMVLQGTSAPPTKWESLLKNDLVLASHCAVLEQTPTENIAIVGNIDNWDVRIISSQTFVLPTGACSGGPVGMSHLVASMLETVHAMWVAGTSAYHCMSYIESKLQEMYLQSETLAAFLLDTEFCSLNKLTTALNLSVNDVPLLLSVASIHSPQVAKRYGVSFR